MTDLHKSLVYAYAEALEAHLAHPDEAALNRAYELGRAAVRRSVSLLEMSALHHQVLRTVAASQPPVDPLQMLDEAGAFFTETLSPFEILLRGNQENNAQLIAMNTTLRETKSAVEALGVAYERSERIATRFQQAALPEALPTTNSLRFDACYEPGPSDPVLGGDWYDALCLADGRVILSIGDVGGSGLSAAVIMATVRQVIRGVAYIHPDPVLILDAAGKALRAEHPDIYASAFVGVIDPVAMTLTYALAGHPPALLRTPGGNVRELAYDGILLGIRTSLGRTPCVVDLTPGSLLVLYTDGLIEATGDILAGLARLHEAITTCSLEPFAGLARKIHDVVLEKPARDDVAILAVEILPSPFQVNDPRGGGVSHWTFDAADATAAQRARTEFVAQLREAGAHDQDVFAAEIVFSELIGNVLRHTPGYADVLVDWTGPFPVLHVRDQGPGFVYAPRLPHDLLAESGRGLYIIAALTEDFNVTRTSGRGSHARAVIALSRHRLASTGEIPMLGLSEDESLVQFGTISDGQHAVDEHAPISNQNNQA